MEWIILLSAGFICFIVGFWVGVAWKARQAKTAREIAAEVHANSRETIINEIREKFGNLSLEALQKFSDLAGTTLKAEREAGAQDLDKKKSLIDQQLQVMTAELDKVAKLMRDLETDRENKFGELSSHLKTANEQTARLTEIAGTLRETLASEKARGKWGERMAEDVLRLAGFVENVNYVKGKAIEGEGTRPDYTFNLPKGLTVNMDVKFPFDNYVRYIGTQAETEKREYRDRFLRDVRNRIKEVTTRAYINPEQKTVDYVLLFIPNEQVYAFIHEQDANILDEGLKNRVVFCSPVTLFAVLAVIRQAIDNFAFEKKSDEILTLLGSFKKQWGEFKKRLDVMGKRIADAQKEYEKLSGTRTRQLERPLTRLDDIRMERRLPSAPDDIADDYKV